jgi:hypothetical protein
MGTAASVIPAGRVGRSSPSRGWDSGNRMTFGQGAHRVRLLRCFDTRTAGRHSLTTGTDGARLRWIVSRASEGYSKHARAVRIAYTLSRDTTAFSKATRYHRWISWLTVGLDNCCHAHRSLKITHETHVVPRSPTMAAKLTDHIWSSREWLLCPVVAGCDDHRHYLSRNLSAEAHPISEGGVPTA